MDAPDFAAAYLPLAYHVTQGTKVSPYTVLLMAYLESGKGLSRLTRDANNFFGIKATGNHPYVTYDTKEYVGGKMVTVKARFKKYAEPSDSFADFVRLVQTPRYADALNQLNPLDQIAGLIASGYATDPNYIKKVTSLLSEFNTTSVGTGKQWLGVALLIAMSAFSNGR